MKKITIFGIFILFSALLVLAVHINITSFLNKDNPLTLNFTGNYFKIAKSENSSFDRTYFGFCVYSTEYYNYTNPEFSFASEILLETTQSGNVTLPSLCVKEKLEFFRCENPYPFKDGISCKTSKGTWVQAVTSELEQDFTNIYPKIPYETLYISIPIYSKVQNISFNVTGIQST